MKVEVIVKIDGEEKQVTEGRYAFGFVGYREEGEEKDSVNAFSIADIEDPEQEGIIWEAFANLIINTIEGVVKETAPEGCEGIGKEAILYKIEKIMENELVPEEEGKKHTKLRRERLGEMIMESFEELFKEKEN